MFSERQSLALPCQSFVPLEHSRFVKMVYADWDSKKYASSLVCSRDSPLFILGVLL